jgi:phage terminase small subunit
MKQLTRLQERFVGFYVSNPKANLAQVYRDAGYRAANDEVARVNAGKLLRLSHVKAAVASARGVLREKFECSAEDIARELHKLAFANMADFLRVTPQGDPFIDLSTLTRDRAAALTEATVEDFTDGRGENAREVRRVRVKLADKRSSLMDLARLLGYGKPERLEHEHRVVAIDEHASDEELLARVEHLLNKARRKAP